jgi:hypothetical protein
MWACSVERGFEVWPLSTALIWVLDVEVRPSPLQHEWRRTLRQSVGALGGGLQGAWICRHGASY